MNYTHLKRNVQTTQRQPVPPAPQMKGFVDCRPEFAAQRKLINGIQNSSGVAQCSLKIGENVYDIKEGTYRVNGKEAGNYQYVIAKIKKNVEETTKEKTEAGEKKYKWDDNWNNIVADFVKCEKVVEFSNIGEFVGELENTMNQDYTMLNRLLKGLSAVKMMRPLEKITFDESVLKKEIDPLLKSIEETQNAINIIEKTCLDKDELQKNVTAKKNILDTLLEEYDSLSEEQRNLCDEKEIISTHWENIVTCRKILKKYPLAKKLERFRMDLLDVEINFAEKAPEMNDKLLPPTRQKINTTMCWFLSVFEGLRRAKLVYPIIERLIDDPESESIFSGFSGFQDWQLLLERKFMDYNGLLRLAQNTFRPNKSKNKIEDKQIMVAFFNGIDPKFPGVLAGYTYLLEQDTSLHIDSNSQDLGLALEKLPKKGEIQKDSEKISFYTVDKPGHAMFYLGMSSYVDKKKGEQKCVKEKINKLKLSYDNELEWIDRAPKFAELKQTKKSEENKSMTIAEKKLMKVKITGLKTERDDLKELAKSKFNKELDEIKKIPITGYYVKVYNQSHHAEETYQLGLIARIQKHTFTLNKKATSTK